MPLLPTQDARARPRAFVVDYRGGVTMAAEPQLTYELLAKFGPLRSYPTGQRIDTTVDPDRLVKTHCCFCGQQCGIQLKVKSNEVIGFEPWEDFPFNKGMLCPKGVRRYLQGAHHDRLTRAYFRDPSST